MKALIALIAALIIMSPRADGESTALTPNAKFQGTIGDVGEVDTWSFVSLAGAKLALDLAGTGGTTVSASLAHRVTGEVVPLNGASMAAGKKLTLKVKKLPHNGVYDLRIGSPGGGGQYSGRIALSLPKKLQELSNTQTLAVGEVISIPVQAVPGFQMSIVTKAYGKGAVAPTILSTVMPDGGALEHVVTTIGKTSKSTKQKLPQSGLYVCKVSPTNLAGKVTLTVKLSKPKLLSDVIHEGHSADVSDAIEGVLQSSDSDASVAFDAYKMALNEAFNVAVDPNSAYLSVRMGLLENLTTQSEFERIYSIADHLAPLQPVGSPSSSIFGGIAGGLCSDAEDVKSRLYFVNGIMTTQPEAVALTMQIRDLMSDNFPQQASEIEFWSFYNPTAKDNVAVNELCAAVSFDVLAALLLKDKGTAPGFEWLNFVTDSLVSTTAAVKDACVASMGFAGDIGEAYTQWMTNKLGIHAPLTSSILLSEAVAQDVASGRTVILVGHSQGNFVIEQALQAMSLEERQSVGVIAVASPTSFEFPGQYGDFSRTTIVGDIIQWVPGAPGSTVALTMSGQATCGQQECLCGIAMHGMGTCYLPHQASGMQILTAIRDAANDVQNPNPDVGQGYFQVAATWDSPGDIDLHVYEPGGAHVYFSNQLGEVGELDHDDISGTGPENYFVCQQSKLQLGAYGIGINNYGGDAGTHVKLSIRAGNHLNVFTTTVGESQGGSGNNPPTLVTVTYHGNGQFSWSN